MYWIQVRWSSVVFSELIFVRMIDCIRGKRAVTAARNRKRIFISFSNRI